jgi:hypothetical protein
MKLFLAIAVVAVLAVIVLAMQRGGTRVTTITHTKEEADEEGGDNA